MERTYELVVGTALFLIGLLSIMFREGFGGVPIYLSVANIIFGAWGLLVGFAKTRARRNIDMDRENM